MTWYNIYYDNISFDMIWYNMILSCVVSCNMIWCLHVMRCDVMFACLVIWYDVIWCSCAAECVVVWCDLIWCDVIWCCHQFLLLLTCLVLSFLICPSSTCYFLSYAIFSCPLPSYYFWFSFIPPHLSYNHPLWIVLRNSPLF